MGHSQAEKAASRERILEAAALQIREGGLDSLSIAELMKAANLTHGGFYGHFPSRSALVSAALDRALDKSLEAFGAAPSKAPGTMKSIVNRYLGPAHRDDPGGGCAMAALAGDAARSDDPQVREQMSRRVGNSIARLARAMGDGPGADDAATVALCAMIGAIALSRVSRGEPMSERILKAVRQGVLDLEAEVRGQADDGGAAG